VRSLTAPKTSGDRQSRLVDISTFGDRPHTNANAMTSYPPSTQDISHPLVPYGSNSLVPTTSPSSTDSDRTSSIASKRLWGQSNSDLRDTAVISDFTDYVSHYLPRADTLSRDQRIYLRNRLAGAFEKGGGLTDDRGQPRVTRDSRKYDDVKSNVTGEFKDTVDDFATTLRDKVGDFTRLDKSTQGRYLGGILSYVDDLARRSKGSEMATTSPSATESSRRSRTKERGRRTDRTSRGDSTHRSDSEKRKKTRSKKRSTSPPSSSDGQTTSSSDEASTSPRSSRRSDKSTRKNKRSRRWESGLTESEPDRPRRKVRASARSKSRRDKDDSGSEVTERSKSGRSTSRSRPRKSRSSRSDSAGLTTRSSRSDGDDVDGSSRKGKGAKSRKGGSSSKRSTRGSKTTSTTKGKKKSKRKARSEGDGSSAKSTSDTSARQKSGRSKGKKSKAGRKKKKGGNSKSKVGTRAPPVESYTPGIELIPYDHTTFASQYAPQPSFGDSFAQSMSQPDWLGRAPPTFNNALPLDWNTVGEMIYHEVASRLHDISQQWEQIHAAHSRPTSFGYTGYPSAPTMSSPYGYGTPQSTLPPVSFPNMPMYHPALSAHQPNWQHFNESEAWREHAEAVIRSKLATVGPQGGHRRVEYDGLLGTVVADREGGGVDQVTTWSSQDRPGGYGRWGGNHPGEMYWNQSHVRNVPSWA
jgi:hypothetical protein